MINSTAKSGTSGGVTTNPIDTTGATLICVLVGSDNANINASDSKNNTWTPLTKYGSVFQSRWYYCLNPSAGANHTFSTTTQFAPIQVLVFGGENYAYHSENGAEASLATSLSTGTITPPANSLVITGLIHQLTSTHSVNNSFAKVAENGLVGGNSYGSGAAWKVQSGAISATWSSDANAADYLTVSIAAFRVLDLAAPSKVTGLTVDANRVVTSQVASDNVGVAGYQTQYRDDGGAWTNFVSDQQTFTDTVPYLTATGDHTRDYRRRAYDAAPNYGEWSDVVTVNYTVSAPSIAIVSPVLNQTLSGIVSVEAVVSNLPNPSGVTFKINDTQIGAKDTDAPYVRTFDTTTVPNGDYSFRAITDGNLETSVAVKILNIFSIGNNDPFIWDRVRRPEYYYPAPLDWEGVTRRQEMEDGGVNFNELSDSAAQIWEIRYTGLSPAEDQIFENHFNLKRISRPFSFVAKNGQTYTNVFYKESKATWDSNKSWVRTRTIVLVKYPQ